MTRVGIPEPADAMETIRHLRAELQSVLEREAATHARHDARVEALEAQIADLEATVQPAPVAVQTVLSNPLKDRGKMIKPLPGAPAGGYPLTPNPVDVSQGRETGSKPSVDLTPEAVEQLHPFRALVRQVDPVQGNGTWDEEFMAVRYDDVEPIVRALSARVVELEAERDEAIGANILNRNAVRMQQVKRHASERALATARADALREAAGVASFRHDENEIMRATWAMPKLTGLDDVAEEILALITQKEKPHE